MYCRNELPLPCLSILLIYIEYVLNAGAENSDMMVDIKPGHGEGRRCRVDMDQGVQEHSEWPGYGYLDIGIYGYMVGR